MIESLTGYIVRLAGAHVVSPRALLYKQLGPCVGTYQSAPDGSRHPYLSFVYDAHTLNGLTESAEKWAAAVSVATGVENIRLLTMLPWQGFVCARPHSNQAGMVCLLLSGMAAARSGNPRAAVVDVRGGLDLPATSPAADDDLPALRT